jgi:hypothetical protein
MNRLLTLTLTMSVLSCERVTVREYVVPKEELPQRSTVRAQIEQASAQTSGIDFKTPPGWKVQPRAPMRKASFLIEAEDGAKVDISVTSFPDASGGLLANINRWRGQLGLEDLEADLLEQTIERRTLAGREFVIVDLATGPAMEGRKQRIVGAILAARGETWFFKMTGDDALTAAQKPAFFELLESVRFGNP